MKGAPAARWSGTLVGVFGILLWATETALAEFTTGLPTFEIVALAFGVAACLSPLAWWWTGEEPRLAFRQPATVWLLTVPSLVSYHAAIYYALRWAPPAPAAVLQGCTPLFLVLGSALLPGGRLRWWHLAGLVAGGEGLTGLVLDAGNTATGSPSCLVLIGAAAGLWGIYSLLTSRLGAVPTSAMGVFYAASAALASLLHLVLEDSVIPDARQMAAIAALGLLPMGLALFCWDHGLKRGDVRALGVASYVEPLIGAGLVVMLGQGDLRWPLLASAFVIIGGAVLGAADAFEPAQETGPGRPLTTTLTLTLPQDLLDELERAAARQCQRVDGLICAILARDAAHAFDGGRGSDPPESRHDRPVAANPDIDVARKRPVGRPRNPDPSQSGGSTRRPAQLIEDLRPARVAADEVTQPSNIRRPASHGRRAAVT